MEETREDMLQNHKNFQMVSSYESTRTLYHDSEAIDETAVSDICSYSINSGSVKTANEFSMGEYFALLINDIGVVFVATVMKNNTMTCHVWTRFGGLVIPNLSAGYSSQNYHLQVVLEHYCNIKDISRMIKLEVPQLDLPRMDYESEIRHLVSIAIKSLMVVQDKQVIELLKKYQDEMKFSSYIVVDIIVNRQALGEMSFEDLLDSIGVNDHSFQNYPFGSNPSPFLDSLGISSYKAPRNVESRDKNVQPSKASWIHEFKSLISTEKSYLKSLKSLKNHYYNYFREAFEKYSYDHICVDLDDLIDLSEELLENIEKIPDQDISEILCAFDIFLDRMQGPFSKFILEANAAKLFIKPTHEKSFNECARLFGAPFNSLFSAPIQRITRYPMSLDQIARTLDSDDLETVKKASALARRSKKIAADIDSGYCRELNRGFSRDLVNKLKISGKVVNAKHQFVAEFEIQSLNSKVPVDHILLILNHVLIIVPKTSKSSTSHHYVLLEKEIEKLYDLKHTIILGLENVTIVESLLEYDHKQPAGMSFQISDKSYESGYRHYFFRAKSRDEKSKIMKYINQFIVFSKLQKFPGLAYSEYGSLDIFYNFCEEDKINLNDRRHDIIFSICKDGDPQFNQALIEKFCIGVMKLQNNLLSCEKMSGSTGGAIDSSPFSTSDFFDSMNIRLKKLVDNIISFHEFSSTRLKAEAYLNLCFSILKNAGMQRSSSAFSILSRKSRASTRSSLIDFTRKMSELVRTPSIKRHTRGSTTNSDMWAHPPQESNMTPRKLGLPKNRAESFFLRPRNILRLVRKTDGSNEFNLLDVLRVFVGHIEVESQNCEYIYETTKLSGKASAKEADKIIGTVVKILTALENFRGSLNGLSKFNSNDVAKILVTLITDTRMQRYLLNSSIKSCILDAAKEEPNDSELIPYIREFLSELPASNKRCLHLLLNHWKKVTDSPKYIIDLKTMADKLSIFISNEAVDFRHATLALESMIFYADTLFEDLEKMQFTYSNITLTSSTSSDAFLASESSNLQRTEDSHFKAASSNDISSNPRSSSHGRINRNESADSIVIQAIENPRNNAILEVAAFGSSDDHSKNLEWDADCGPSIHEEHDAINIDFSKLKPVSDPNIKSSAKLEAIILLDKKSDISVHIVENQRILLESTSPDNIFDDNIHINSTTDTSKMSESTFSLQNLAQNAVLIHNIDLEFKIQQIQPNEETDNDLQSNEAIFSVPKSDHSNSDDLQVEDICESQNYSINDIVEDTNCISEINETIGSKMKNGMHLGADGRQLTDEINSKTNVTAELAANFYHEEVDLDMGIFPVDISFKDLNQGDSSLPNVQATCHDDPSGKLRITSNDTEENLANDDDGLEATLKNNKDDVECEIILDIHSDLITMNNNDVVESEVIMDSKDFYADLIPGNSNDDNVENEISSDSKDAQPDVISGDSNDNMESEVFLDSKDFYADLIPGNSNDDNVENEIISDSKDAQTDIITTVSCLDDYLYSKEHADGLESAVPQDTEDANLGMDEDFDSKNFNDEGEEILDGFGSKETDEAVVNNFPVLDDWINRHDSLGDDRSSNRDGDSKEEHDDQDMADKVFEEREDTNGCLFQSVKVDLVIESHTSIENSPFGDDSSSGDDKGKKCMDEIPSNHSDHEAENFFSFDHILNDKGTPPFEDALEYQNQGLLSLETSQLDLEAECIQGLALLKKRSSEAQD